MTGNNELTQVNASLTHLPSSPPHNRQLQLWPLTLNFHLDLEIARLTSMQ